jgi:hypothetical protein
MESGRTFAKTIEEPQDGQTRGESVAGIIRVSDMTHMIF